MKTATVIAAKPSRFAAATFQGNFEENAGAIARIGFDAIEFSVGNPADVNIKDCKRVLKANHLALAAVATGDAYTEHGLSLLHADESVRGAALRRVKEQTEFAAEFGAIVILARVRGNPDPSVPFSTSMEWLKAGMAKICRHAAALGVKIATEPLNRYEQSYMNTLSQAKKFIGEVGEPNHILLADTFHMNIEEASMPKSILDAGGLIGHMHFADSNRWAPGAGHINFKEIYEALLRTGYKGYLSAEALPLPGDALTAARLAMETFKWMTG